jgi:hypothetical protein
MMWKDFFAVAAGPVLFTAFGFDDGFAQKSDCDLRAVDSVYLSLGPVYRECAVDRKARPKNRPLHSRTMTMPNKTCLSAEFEFVVDTLGLPEHDRIRLVRSNDSPFADREASAIQEMTFTPAMKDGAKVRQIYRHRSTISIVMSGPSGQTRLSRC